MSDKVEINANKKKKKQERCYIMLMHEIIDRPETFSELSFEKSF